MVPVTVEGRGVVAHVLRRAVLRVGQAESAVPDRRRGEQMDWTIAVICREFAGLRLDEDHERSGRSDIW